MRNNIEAHELGKITAFQNFKYFVKMFSRTMRLLEKSDEFVEFWSIYIILDPFHSLSSEREKY